MNLKWIKCLFNGHQPVFLENYGGPDEHGMHRAGSWQCSNCGKQSASIEPDKPWPRMREMTPEEVKNVHRHGSNPLPPGSKPTATLVLPPAPWPELPPLQHDMDHRALLLAYMTRVIDECGISFLDANGRHSPLTDVQMDALMAIEAEALAILQV